VGSLFWTAFALGVAYCAPPGALTVEALRRGLRRGFIGAFLTELGSLVGDAAWAALALSGVAYLVAYRPVSMLLAVLGVVLLFALALNALRDAWVGGLPRARYMSARGDLIAGACISLSNPYAIAFWLGLGGTISGLVPIRLGRPALVVFFAAFMLAAVVWCFFISAMIAWGRRFMHATFYRWVNVACGGVLIYFGVRLLITLLEHPGAFTSR
jgi:chemosensory pili system protein ChpE